MTPPGALRWTTLLLTGVVLLGGVAGFVLWHHLAAVSSGLPSAPPDAVAGTIRRMDPPAGLPAPAVERLRALIAEGLEAKSMDERVRARDALVQEGEAAVPLLLDEIARVATQPPGFDDPMVVARLHRLDRPLAAIRTTLTPGDPAPAWRTAPDAAWARSRAASWFAWWDALARR
jgi:hypothetical protein